MEMNEQPQPSAKDKYMAWARKNTFTLLGIIILLGIVWWEQAHLPQIVNREIKECNDFWRGQVRMACPAVANSGVYKPYFNASEAFTTAIE